MSDVFSTKPRREKTQAPTSGVDTAAVSNDVASGAVLCENPLTDVGVDTAAVMNDGAAGGPRENPDTDVGVAATSTMGGATAAVNAALLKFEVSIFPIFSTFLKKFSPFF